MDGVQERVGRMTSRFGSWYEEGENWTGAA